MGFSLKTIKWGFPLVQRTGSLKWLYEEFIGWVPITIFTGGLTLCPGAVVTVLQKDHRSQVEGYIWRAITEVCV